MENARAKTAVSSTQENAFMVLAAEALADKSRTIALFVDGVPQQGAFFKSWRAAALANITAPHNTSLQCASFAPNAPVTSRAAIARLKAGWHLPLVRGGVLRRTKLRDPPGNAVNPRLQEKYLSILMRMDP
jgi:hypothetical protein